MNANIRRTMQGIRADGVKYGIDYSTGVHGFRIWGDLTTSRRRLLVVGDSFTEAPQASDQRTYYSILKKLAGEDWELFAYGQGGYGTLQECMVLERYLAMIKPDLVVWQWCSNDLSNNSFYLDSHSFENLNMLPRPYFENNQIHLRCPHYVPLLSYHSALWRYVGPRAAVMILTGRKSSVDGLSPDSPVMKDALTITDGILTKAEAILGRTPTYVFVVGSDEDSSALCHLARKHGFRTIDGFNRALKEAEQSGVVVSAHPSIGGHWSEDGHEAVARILHQAIHEGNGFAEARTVATGARNP